MSEKNLFTIIYIAAMVIIAIIGYLLDPQTHIRMQENEEDDTKQLNIKQRISAVCWFVTMAALFSLIFILDDEPVSNNWPAEISGLIRP